MKKPSKVKIDCNNNQMCGWATIELPNGPRYAEGTSRAYLWIGAEDKYFGTIESRRELKKLRTMIDKILESK